MARAATPKKYFGDALNKSPNHWMYWMQGPVMECGTRMCANLNAKSE
jgi:hypothetical protein